MSNKKNLIISIIIVIIVLLIALIIINISKSKKQTNINKEMIIKSYNNLTTSVKSYNEVRTKYDEMTKDFVLSTYKSKQTEYEELLNKYNDIIKNIDSEVTQLNGYCTQLYDDGEVNKICDGYKNLYEKLINIYVTDLNNYNDKIKAYNEYQNESLKLFTMVHNDYIDYNEDKIYEGRD